ncbi:BTAD domain-containing putative transcriptional regulator [Deinococcus yavapaiensis]|uniref:AAA ATPase-like protein n=1 Tax=Deinococcus yavapaiensis KR-236 TaxID=694435 RepID=A0A318S4W1_9DEIO|nr:BTAD domain-containing putative transcriptional regulator [Deinococcus yavapaiensis]PYE53117.1 AAA ATPase-like protein [Deinococcus yavapaiensis KR-236]
MSNGSWRFAAFGKPRLFDPDGRAVRVEGRTLALLAYLALEGPTPRSRLAGLLWPDTPEGAARNNLVHLLRRIAKSHAPHLVAADENVALGAGLTVDLALLVRSAPDPADVPGGALLDGVDLDHSPDLAEWLLAWRERLDARRVELLAVHAAELEAKGEYAVAVRVAARLLDLAPVSEDAHRRVMRLNYLLGDRPAALKAYHRCQDVLWKELGVKPMPETADLARLIDRGAVDVPTLRPPTLPPSVLRPPVLVGREREWNRMERAWHAGRLVLLVGPPGVGKSRLMHDFVASKGTAFRLEGRPGDRGAPYATTARMLRRVLDALEPGFSMPDWVSDALGPLLPGRPALGTSTFDPRLGEAINFMSGVGIVAQGAVATIFEDLHLVDAATTEMGMAMLSSSFPLGRPGGLPHFVGAFRDEDLEPHVRALFRRFVDAGQAEWIDVGPLDDEAVKRLVATVEVPHTLERAAELAAFTGGNPLFVLETLRRLVERGPTEVNASLPVAERVGQLIGQRLAGLTRSALHAARAAAVLQSDFDLELVADTLRAPLLETAAAWEELERAHVVVGERFSHDVMAEVLRAETPEGVRRLLHRAAARALAQRPDALPSRVAHHWQAGGDGARAAPWLVEAGHAARRTARLGEAASFFARAAAASEPHDADGAFDALAARAEMLALMQDAEHAHAVRDLHARAVTPLQRATAFMQEYRLLESTLDVERLSTVVEAGFAALRVADDGAPERLVEAQLQEGAALVAFIEGREDDTARHLNRMRVLGELTGSVEWQAKAHEGLGLAHSYGAPRAAREHLERAEAMHLRRGDFVRAGSSLVKLARVLAELGENRAASEVASRGEAHLDRLDVNLGERVALRFSQIVVAQLVGDFEGAYALYERSLRDHTLEHSSLLASFPLLHAKTLRLTRRRAEARAALEAARSSSFPGHLRALLEIEAAATLREQGHDLAASERLEAAAALLAQRENVAWRARWLDLRGEPRAAAALRELHGLSPRGWSAL